MSVALTTITSKSSGHHRRWGAPRGGGGGKGEEGLETAYYCLGSLMKGRWWTFEIIIASVNDVRAMYCWRG